jgi:hypothetical protein
MAAHQWQRSDGSGREGGGAAMAMAAQQRQWQRSNGNGGAAIVMAVQRWLWTRSNGNGNGGAAMGVAVVAAAQQWRRSK